MTEAKDARPEDFVHYATAIRILADAFPESRYDMREVQAALKAEIIRRVAPLEAEEDDETEG